MINANEWRIIDIAAGTFEYQDELYTAHPSYLSLLKDKLNEEKYDLTAEQADQLIQKIFANIENGVKKGILQKVTGKKAEKAKKEGKVKSLSEIGVTGDEEVSEETGEIAEATEKPEMVTGKDGKSYPIQKNPLQMSALSEFSADSVKQPLQEYTSNEQVQASINENTTQTGTVMSVSLVICIIVLAVYLKVFKHRHKAFLVMLGVVFATVSMMALGSIYVNNIRAYSPETWQEVALESGYFKECTKSAQQDLQKVLTDVGMEAEVGILNLNEDVVYRDAKSVFSACLSGGETPKLKKREEEIQKTLQEILPQESVQNVESLSGVLMECYRESLKTPYASYLYEAGQKNRSHVTGCIIISIFVLLISISLIRVGSKYIHRSFRGLAYAFWIAGVCFIAAGVFIQIQNKALSIEPESYRSLFEHYLSWRSENVLYFGILLFCLGIFTWGAAYVTKRNHIEKLGLK